MIWRFTACIYCFERGGYFHAGAENVENENTHQYDQNRDEYFFGCVAGVVTREDNKEVFYEARRGVVLASGGFIMNKEMTAKYIPEIHSWATPYGNPFDMGDGIRLGMAAGGSVINMDQAFLF